MKEQSHPVVRVRRLKPGAALPTYMSDNAAGMDLSAAMATAVTLPPMGRQVIATGLALAIPDGYEGQVRPRSGLARRSGVTILNAPGTIDADYRGEVLVLLVNLSNEDVVIEPGERIAQLVIAPVARAATQEVDSLEDTDRGAGGFGSTGRG